MAGSLIEKFSRLVGGDRSGPGLGGAAAATPPADPSKATACYECERPFGLLVAKQSCSICSQFFCDACSQNFVPAPRESLADRGTWLRVCNFCKLVGELPGGGRGGGAGAGGRACGTVWLCGCTPEGREGHSAEAPTGQLQRAAWVGVLLRRWGARRPLVHCRASGAGCSTATQWEAAARTCARVRHAGVPLFLACTSAAVTAPSHTHTQATATGAGMTCRATTPRPAPRPRAAGWAAPQHHRRAASGEAMRGVGWGKGMHSNACCVQ